jgi:hypothetical protein
MSTPTDLQFVVLPKRKDVWATPAKKSPTRILITKLAPNPGALKWYRDLPPIGGRIWAVWRNGKYGFAEYIGGWSYKADKEYLCEMPVAWHLADALPRP